MRGSYFMEKENNKLDELMSRQPFRVPDGYFEGFTEDIMSRIPEKPVSESEKISLYTRIKPLLYLAAMFAGAIILLNIISDKKANLREAGNGASVKSGLISSTNDPADIGEDADFLEYIEDMYADKYAISYIDDFMDNW